ncbi:MAG: BamA/TamA family outer membrane protein [Kofleriaceae bacterium]
MRSLFFVLALSSVAHADPVAAVSEPKKPGDADVVVERAPVPEFDPTKPDTDGTAPAPDRASGVVVEAEEPVANKVRVIPRALLFVPRWMFWGFAQPFRGAAYAYEQYSLQNRVKATLFNDDGTYGVYPVASYSTDFGFDLGARFVHYNLFGEKERIKVRANFGGRYQQAYGLELRSGQRLGKRISGSIETIYEKRPDERFFGIGNATMLTEMPAELIDPSLADTAISSRFRENWFRTVAKLEGRVRGPFAVRISGALALRDFADFKPEDPSDPFDSDDLDEFNLGIEQRFDTSKLVGYERGVDNIYLETEVIYDTRRPSTKYAPRVLDSTGWYASIHGGRAIGVGGDPTAFYRYGGEVQRFFDLYEGNRILALRAMVDATAGGDGRTEPYLSFIDLPRLGGTEFLRGYPEGRFRDKAVALGTAEYTWDLGNFLAAYTFVDVGRALRGLDQIVEGSASDWHLGFGGGVQVHTNASFLMRGQLAFSREGDAFLELVFSPAFGRRERAGRY